jgi:peptidylprolyl isomerase
MMKSTPLIAAACLILAGCGKPATTPTPTPSGTSTAATGTTAGAMPPRQLKPGVSKLTSLTKTDLKVGDGMLQGIKVGTTKGVENGDLVSLQYTGKLTDGTLFDTNVPGSKLNGKPNTHAKPLVFYVGRGFVIGGMDQGILGMKVGGRRKIGVPPAMGYGPQDNGPIPGNSDLYFDIVLLDVVKRGEEGLFDFKTIAEGSGRPIKTGDTLHVEYTVKLADGTVVDTNVGKEPYEFTIGEIPPKVISGIEQGVVGMKKGGVKLLRIPPQIGYGSKLVTGIPSNSTLVVQVKVLEVM